MKPNRKRQIKMSEKWENTAEEMVLTGETISRCFSGSWTKTRTRDGLPHSPISSLYKQGSTPLCVSVFVSPFA